MIKHIVMFKFKNKDEVIAEVLKRAQDMIERIDCKISMKAVTNVPSSDERNCDFALICEFESIEQLEQYKIHPVHVAFGKFITPLRESRACIDYEV